MKKRIGIINVNLQYEIPSDGINGPKEYVEDSFEIVKIIEEEI